VFSYIYLDNLSPAKVMGFWAGAGRNELAVDNFLAVFFFNDFNAQTLKSIKSTISRDFSWITHAELWITSADWRASPTSADLGSQHSEYSGG
jgi:hypothetical protein